MTRAARILLTRIFTEKLSNMFNQYPQSLSFDLICENFHLGQLLKPPRPIAKYLHQVWHITTTQGEFAVKFFNNAVRSLQKNLLLGHNQTQQIAATLKEQGIATAVALQADKNSAEYCLTIDQQCIMVFPWLPGSSINGAALTVIQAKTIGHLLAKIHGLHLSAALNSPPLWGVYSADKWQHMLAQIKYAQITELTFLSDRLAHLIHWSNLAQQALSVLNQDLVLSHRDLDPKNVLWQNAVEPVLIDWEYAGPINPQLERLIVAYNWSGITTGRPNKELFQAVLAGYSEGGCPSEKYSQQVLIEGYVGYVLDWIVFNCWRAIHIKDQRQQACEEVFGSLGALDYIINLL